MKVHQDGLGAKESVNIGSAGVPNEIDEWDDLINKLQNSINFITTHSLIRKLAKNNNWTPLQANELCRAVLINNQVELILGDNDVNKFYRGLLSNIEIEQMCDGPIRSVYEMLFNIE